MHHHLPCGERSLSWGRAGPLEGSGHSSAATDALNIAGESSKSLEAEGNT